MKPRYLTHYDFRLPMGFSPKNFDSALNYQPQATDTFIVTYPKCGTTWTQNIVWTIFHDGNQFPTNKNINLEIPHLEEVGREFITSLPSPRFIKTHLNYDLTPYHNEAKYLYIARNPFDCVVSFYYHTKGFPKHYDFADGTFEDYFECFINGEVDWGDYFDHLIPWISNRNDSNFLLLTYEFMKSNPKEAIILIARFLGPRYVNKIENKKILEDILKHTSFTSMSKNQSRWSSQRPVNTAPFIRRGEVGDWKSHFSNEQLQRLTSKFKAKTNNTKASALWKII